VNLFVYVMLGLMIGAAPALAAVEQCRFIQAKADREACYQQQAAALAAKRKPEPTGDATAMESLQQMRQEDDAVYKACAASAGDVERFPDEFGSKAKIMRVRKIPPW